MNIALFSDCYYPTKNGVVTVVMQARTILQSMGHHVVIVTVDTPRLVGGEVAEGDSDPCVLRVPSVPVGYKTDNFMGFPQKSKIIKFLKAHNVEIIHCHTEFVIARAAKIIGKSMHIPVIVTTHTMWEDYFPHYVPFGRLVPTKVVRKIAKRLYSNFYAMINVSAKAEKYFKQPLVQPHTPSAIIPNAIDISSFQANEYTPKELIGLRQSWGIDTDDVLILYVGRIAEEKRIFELLNIFEGVIRKSNKSVRAMLIGNGPAFKAVKDEVRQRGLLGKIVFTGYIGWDELHSYYAMADIFATASLSEMHSMTILEAMTSSIPIVARDDLSFYDTVIDGQNGFLAKTDEDMQERLLALIEDGEKRERFGKMSKEISQNFSLEAHGKKTVAFYEEALKAFPGKLDEEKLRKAVANSY